MAKNKELKTNAMRILDTRKIPYEHISYECEGFVDGIHMAKTLNLPFEKVFKTLVTQGKSREYHVFVIPVEEELDRKKAAKTVGEKSVEMIPVKEITNVTGYVRGGCTAIGMKKAYSTIIDRSAEKLDRIYISAGKIGEQLCLTPEDFIRASGAAYADLTVLPMTGRNMEALEI